ncbi:UNVERIFIED_CONTAM: hypothetical protein Sangu_1464300 [Sesamum angustifolium]|uniref:CCHC-type domain-containing protein n=1 Tax=Sesamum angustifolium TaxID=2727405 RepID=A0AAW2N644_9LAMI
MADQGGINIRWEAMEARVRRLEELIGNGRKPEDEGEGGVAGDRSERAGVCSDEISCLTDAVDYKLESLKADLRLVKLAVANSGTDGSAVAPKVRVPDPKPFGGERSAKELENFLWDMETYFQAARVPDTEKVSITSMYLTGDAKLWWRSRLSDDASANRERIETWEVLKKELKDQFLPCNTSWLARESLRNLKHTGTVREFVKEFQFSHVGREGYVRGGQAFNFMAGLKPWAQTELRRQGVKDLPTAIAAADRLGDYKVPNEPEQRSDFWRRETEAGCFICGNLEHRARDCPKRGRLNAIVAEHTDSEQETGPARVGAMQLGTLQVQSRGVGRHIRKVWLWYQAESTSGEGCELKSGASKRIADAELCVGSWSGQCKFVTVGLDDFDVILGIDFFVNANVIILPRMCGIFISGGDKPSFVKGEYDGGTEAGKKSGVAEARSSNASSSKEGAQSPRLAGFSCIGTMQEEMHKRWTKAQQICGAEPETFTCEEMLKRERGVRGWAFHDVREEAGISAKYFRGEGKHVSCVDEDVDISWWGWFVRPLKVQCGRHAHWTRQPVTTGVARAYAGVGRRSVGLCWCHGTGLVHSTWHIAGLVEETVGVVRTGCAARGRAGLVGSQRRQTARAGRAGAHVRRRSAGCAHGRAQARTALGRLADGWHKMRPMCGKTRQAGRPCADGLGSTRTVGQASCARTGSAARAHSRQADDCRQRPRLGGWLRMLKHKTCAGHVMGRLRLVTAHLHGNSGKLQARRLWTVFHSGCRQFWSVFPSSWGCQLHCYVFICFSRIGHGVEILSAETRN